MIFAVSGFKNSGKTTLCMKLIAALQEKGLRVGYVKRTSEAAVELGENDTSYALKKNVRTALWGSNGLSVTECAPVTTEHIISSYFPDMDIVILEGGKYLNIPKIWVKSSTPKPDDVTAVFASYDRNAPDEEKQIKQLAEKIAGTVLSAAGTRRRSTKIFIGDKLLPIKDFIADFVRGSIIGMLASLKGTDTERKIHIFIQQQ